MRQLNKELSYPGKTHRFVFNSEQECRDNGGVPTNVEFVNGKAVFEGGNIVLDTPWDNTIRTIRFNWSNINETRDYVLYPYLSIRFSENVAMIRFSQTSYQYFIVPDALYNNGLAHTATLVIDYDNVTNSELYVNNSRMVKDSGTMGLPFVPKDRLTLGDRFTGKIDFIEIYNRALSPSEIYNLHYALDSVELPMVKRKGFDVAKFDGSSCIGNIAHTIGATTDFEIEFEFNPVLNATSGILGGDYTLLDPRLLIIGTGNSLYLYGVNNNTTLVWVSCFNYGVNQVVKLKRVSGVYELLVNDVSFGTKTSSTNDAFNIYEIGSYGNSVGSYSGSMRYFKVTDSGSIVYYLNNHAIDSVTGIAATNNGVTFAQTTGDALEQQELLKKPACKLSTGEIVLDYQFELPVGATHYDTGGIYLETLKDKVLLDFSSNKGYIPNPTIYNPIGQMYAAWFNGVGSKILSAEINLGTSFNVSYYAQFLEDGSVIGSNGSNYTYIGFVYLGNYLVRVDDGVSQTAIFTWVNDFRMHLFQISVSDTVVSVKIDGVSLPLTGNQIDGTKDFIVGIIGGTRLVQPWFKGYICKINLNNQYIDSLNGSTIGTPTNITYTKFPLAPAVSNITFPQIGNNKAALANGVDSVIHTNSDLGGLVGDISILGWFNAKSYGEGDFGGLVDNDNMRLWMEPSMRMKFTRNNNSNNLSLLNISFNKLHFILITSTLTGLTSISIGTLNTPLVTIIVGSAGTPVAGGNVILMNNEPLSRTFDGTLPRLQIREGIISLEEAQQFMTNSIKDVI